MVDGGIAGSGAQQAKAEGDGLGCDLGSTVLLPVPGGPSHLKPSNIFVGRDMDGTEYVKVLDDIGEQELLDALLIRIAMDLCAEESTRCFQECGGDLDRMVLRLEVSKRALQRRVREPGLDRGPGGVRPVMGAEPQCSHPGRGSAPRGAHGW